MSSFVESFLERRPLLCAVLGVRRKVKRLEPGRPLPKEVISLRRGR